MKFNTRMRLRSTWNLYVRVRILIYLCIASHFSDQHLSALVDNGSYVLDSHERLPVHMDLRTAETGVSLVGNTKAVKGRTGGAVED